MGPDAWSMDYAAWCMDRAATSAEHTTWYMDHAAWPMIHGPRRTVHDHGPGTPPPPQSSYPASAGLMEKNICDIVFVCGWT